VSWKVCEEEMPGKENRSLSAITESQYYCLKAVGLSEYETGKDFLYQPIPFPSNVQGGTGILGLSATSEQTLYLTEN
jgi:hypothetical protein